ncbi:MAG: elongation factor 1-beta [Candidatus Bathyarchaeia archaeon]
MANVLITMRVYPSDLQVDLNALKDSIGVSLPEGMSIHRSLEEPIAFGLKALVLQIVAKDEAGQMENMERRIRTVEGVGEVEILMISRI